jgi:hypothetical protein
MKKLLFSLLVAVSLCGVVTGQDKALPAAIAAATTNKTDGLEVPASQTVNYDEGFISLAATTDGTVKWLVISTAPKVKFKVNPTLPNEIDIAIPPFESTLTVYAVAVVEGKLTDYVRTDITIKGPNRPDPVPPDPNPTPPPLPPVPPTPDVVYPLYVSIVEDPSKRTPELTALLTDKDLQTKLAAKNIKFRVYGVNDPIVKEKKYDAVFAKYGSATLILQDKTGKALVLSKSPETVTDLLKLLAPYTQGGF